MRARSPLARVMASVLMAAQLPACAPTWRGVGTVAPRDAIEGWRPDTVRVRLTDAGTVVLTEPDVVGDSLVGTTQGRRREERFRLARTDVRVVGWDTGVLVVVRSPGDTLRLRDAWETSDSVGGKRSLAASPLRRSIPLGDVQELQLKRIPRSLVVRGERVRVRYVVGGDKLGAEGQFERVDGDTLVLWQERGRLVRVPVDAVTLAEVQISTASNVGRGALIGAISAGVILGLGTLAYALTEDDPSASGCCGKAIILWGAALLAAVPLVIAPAVGALTRHGRWERVPVEAFGAGADTTAPGGGARR